MIQNLVLRRPLAVVDLETTGLDTRTARIVELSILKVRPDRQAEQFTRRLCPGVAISPGATAVHGITDAHVRAEPRFAEVADDLLARLDGCDLCGFNLKRFDLLILHHEFERAGRSFALEGRALIDAMEIFHSYAPGDLATAVHLYLGRAHVGGHSAAGDVQATAALLDAMLARHPDLQRDVGELHERFRQSRAMDAAGFFTSVDGEVRFTRGKHRGAPLAAVARSSPDYLEWMLGSDFQEDTKAIVRAALQRRRSKGR